MKYLKKFEALDLKVGRFVKFTKHEEKWRSQFIDYDKERLYIITRIFLGLITIHDILSDEYSDVWPNQIELATVSEIEKFQLRIDMKKYNI